MSEFSPPPGNVVKPAESNPESSRPDTTGFRLPKWLILPGRQANRPEKSTGILTEPTERPVGISREIAQDFKDNAWKRAIERVPRNAWEIPEWLRSVRIHKGRLTELLDSDDLSQREKGMQLLEVIAKVDRPDVQKWLCNYARQGIPLFEQEFESMIGEKYPVPPIRSLHLLTTFAIYGDSEQQARTRAFLESHRADLTKGLADSENVEHYAGGIGRLLAHGINIFVKDGKTVDMIYSGLPVSVRAGMIADFLSTPRGTYGRRKGAEWVNQFLAQYALQGSEFLHAWRMGSQGDKKKRIATDLERIISLEASEAGSTRVLTKEFGIYHYYRYPEVMLLRQYRERNRADLPYGVVINAYSDYNGAFRNDSNNKELYTKLSILHNYKYAVRIMEAGSPNEIRKRLEYVNKKYGNEHKIAFAMLGGHGTRNGIRFGEGIMSGKLYVGDLKGRGGSLGQAGEFFEEHPTIILNSCSTGRKRIFSRDSFGQIVSNALGATVFANNSPGAINSLEVSVVDGKPVFRVEFINRKFEDKTIVFRPK